MECILCELLLLVRRVRTYAYVYLSNSIDFFSKFEFLRKFQQLNSN